MKWLAGPLPSDNIYNDNRKGVTVHHRNPWFSLWWRRGDLNSRPPPCEGDALPAELLPHMDATTRRSEVCMPFICRGQVFLCTGRPSVRREGPDIRGMQGTVSYESGSGKQEDMLAPVTVRMGRSSCPPLAPVVSREFSPWYAGRRAPAFPERLQESKAAPKQAGTATPCPPGHRGIPGPCLPAGNPHATPDKARGIPGSSPSAIPEKNRPGRPCGAWLP